MQHSHVAHLVCHHHGAAELVCEALQGTQELAQVALPVCQRATAQELRPAEQRMARVVQTIMGIALRMLFDRCRAAYGLWSVCCSMYGEPSLHRW